MKATSRRSEIGGSVVVARSGFRCATAVLLLMAIATHACANRSRDSVTQTGGERLLSGSPVPEGPLALDVERKLDVLFSDVVQPRSGEIAALARSGDARVAWPLVDLLRFHQGQTKGPELFRALRLLTGNRSIAYKSAWVAYSDLLLRADVPAPPGYFGWKRAAFVGIHEGWEPFFDRRADIDWRHVAWGGVLRDAIRALSAPPMVPAAQGEWLPEDDIVFGIKLAGEEKAYPKRVMEVHEIANDTVDGEPVSLTYCTLCGSAIAYLTGAVSEAPDGVELRTSGLLQRSNKLAYDAGTESLIDQFRGVGLTGPLRGVKLERVPVAVTTWGEWRRAHPETLVTPEEIDDRSYLADPLGDRDKDGPIFPTGERDTRLPSMTVVFGVVTPQGVAVAFDASAARSALRSGENVQEAGVRLRLAAGALEATSAGREVFGHEAFWFAWSQFHPRSLLWSR